MDPRLNGLLKNFVLMHLLLGNLWSSGFSFPVSSSCKYIENSGDITVVLGHEAEKLLREFTAAHGDMSDMLRDDVPVSTVSGNSVAEKLQDICVKNRLFSLHIEQLEEYQREWIRPENITDLLKDIKNRLQNQFVTIKVFYTEETPTPAPLQLSYKDSFKKKSYGYGVIHNLGQWHKQVLLVLNEAKQTCDQKNVA